MTGVWGAERDARGWGVPQHRSTGLLSTSVPLGAEALNSHSSVLLQDVAEVYHREGSLSIFLSISVTERTVHRSTL